jgi:hypothetical protein
MVYPRLNPPILISINTNSNAVWQLIRAVHPLALRPANKRKRTTPRTGVGRRTETM